MGGQTFIIGGIVFLLGAEISFQLIGVNPFSQVFFPISFLIIAFGSGVLFEENRGVKNG